MKKLSILFILFAILSVGCQNGRNTPAAPTSPPAVSSAIPTPTTAAPATDTPDTATPETQPPAPQAGAVEALPDGGARLITGDGLSLTLDAAGQVTALTLNGDTLPLAAAPPLWVRDLTSAAKPDAPNLLANPSFEAGDAGWPPMMQNKTTLEITTETAYEGAHALAIRSVDEGGQGAIISDPVPVTPGSRYRVSAHFRIEFGYVDESGNPTFWQDSLYDGERLTTGLYLQWLDEANAPLDKAPQLAATLHWNAQEWHKITREVTAPAGAAAVQIIAGAKPVTGAVWIDDLAWIESPEMEQPVTGALEIAADHVVQRGEVAGLQVAVTYRPDGDHLAITTSFTETGGAARAFDAAWGLPLDAGGWTWWDGLRESRTVTAGQEYARAVSADIMGYLPISLYPYAALENGTRSLSLALPLDSPRYVLLHYDGVNKRYEGRAHLGISPAATKLNNSADFTLLLYQSDPAWGLRAAADKHAAINPDWYDTPADMSSYSGFVREHFSATGRKGQRLREYDNANVYAAQYIVFELPIHMGDEKSPSPSFTEARQFLDDQVNAGYVKAGFPVSAICDTAGEPHLKTVGVFPWSNGKWEAIWIPNMDPDLPDGYGTRKLDELETLLAETSQAGLTLDGIFIDNFISTSTIDLCPAHLAAADLSLTYEPNTYQPGTHTASAGWEFLVALRALLDAQPAPYRSISINFWALNIPSLLIPYIDAYGGEGASAKGSNWTPDILDYRMATAMERPRLFANQQPNPTLAQVETYIQEALFYGVRPDRGDNGENWPTDSSALLTQAQPEAEALLGQGWQPITLAHTNHPDVWVERFGTTAFTTHNWGNSSAKFTLTIDLAALGLSAETFTVTESLTGKNVAATVTTNGALQISGHLDPDRTAVYWLRP
ncbi:MAG: carbohydrate binding domain-containing protein [Anaerolineae bacterium]